MPQCRRLLEIRFGENVSYVGQKYMGLMNPVNYIENYHAAWNIVPRQEWVHLFIHTLDTIPRNWYTLVKLRRGNIDWDELSNSFNHNFFFVDDNLMIYVAMQVIKDNFV